MYSKLRKSNNFPIVTDADDADVIALAAKVTHEIPCVQGIYHKKVIFEFVFVIVPFHILTDADCVSDFIGDWKKLYNSMKSDTSGELLTSLHLIFSY